MLYCRILIQVINETVNNYNNLFVKFGDSEKFVFLKTSYSVKLTFAFNLTVTWKNNLPFYDDAALSKNLKTQRLNKSCNGGKNTEVPLLVLSLPLVDASERDAFK